MNENLSAKTDHVHIYVLGRNTDFKAAITKYFDGVNVEYYSYLTKIEAESKSMYGIQKLTESNIIRTNNKSNNIFVTIRLPVNNDESVTTAQ
jgi:hypothetical protein